MYPSPSPTVMDVSEKAVESLWQVSQYNPNLKSATQMIFSWASGSSIRLTKYLNLFEQTTPWNFIETTPVLSLCIFIPAAWEVLKMFVYFKKKN